MIPYRAVAAEPMPVIASFTILADIAREIGGARVQVDSLIGANQDAHLYQPSPADARKLVRAKVILINGLGFEPFIDRLVAASGSKVKPTVLSSSLPTLARPGDGKADHGHAHQTSALDPHVWQSVSNARLIARAIARALAAADPEGAAAYDANANAYDTTLAALDAEIRQSLATIPPERRQVTVAHNAFGHFARDYGVAFAALQGVSTESEPSAADIARIIRQVKASKTRAVFLENISDPRKIERIAAETGAKIGGTLYSDSLSLSNGPAPTYIGMMRHNARQIVDALK